MEISLNFEIIFFRAFRMSLKWEDYNFGLKITFLVNSPHSNSAMLLFYLEYYHHLLSSFYLTRLNKMSEFVQCGMKYSFSITE